MKNSVNTHYGWPEQKGLQDASGGYEPYWAKSPASRGTAANMEQPRFE